MTDTHNISKLSIITAVLFLFLSIAISCTVYADANTGKTTPQNAFNEINNRFKLIRDYKADLMMSIKGPQISINQMRMVVYYKQPNKVKIDAREGMAFAPNDISMSSPASKITQWGKPKYLGVQNKRNIECWAYSVTDPKQPTMKMTVWIDPKRMVIIATQAKGEGTISSEWDYSRVSGYYLPSIIKASIDMPSMHGMPQNHKASGNIKTDINVKFSNYAVNKGIPDSLFKEKKADKQPRPHRRMHRM